MSSLKEKNLEALFAFFLVCLCYACQLRLLLKVP